MASFDRIGNAYRTHGPLGLCKLALQRCAGVLAPMIFQARDELIFTRNLSRRDDYRRSVGLVVSTLQPTDLAELQVFIQECNASPVLALQRLRFSLERGYSGVLARLDGRIVGYGWWAPSDTPVHPQARLHGVRLEPNEAFVFDLFIDPGLRKRQAGLEFLVLSEEHGVALGYTKIYSTIMRDNRRSSWVHHLAGWHHLEPARRVRVFASTTIVCGNRLQRYDRRWF